MNLKPLITALLILIGFSLLAPSATFAYYENYYQSTGTGYYYSQNPNHYITYHQDYNRDYQRKNIVYSNYEPTTINGFRPFSEPPFRTKTTNSRPYVYSNYKSDDFYYDQDYRRQDQHKREYFEQRGVRFRSSEDYANNYFY